ncbi:Outer membrane protein W precursor [Kluyvera cryocrescens]|uniref:Outer membrane protein W n=1 Tax=Kluyvera cryocrescens TaxID=580 RepID=A0A485A3L8_KLUCR|nr:Outer membrane protein W precursor [Kluyvera cryocrescens]
MRGQRRFVQRKGLITYLVASVVLNVSNNTQLGLTFTYMATDNIGIELLAASPFRHKVGTGPTG